MKNPTILKWLGFFIIKLLFHLLKSSRHSLIILLLSIIVIGCSQENNAVPNIRFTNFSGFPKYIFKQIKLGEPTHNILTQIVSQPGKILYEDEYFHYRYASDSTEIIIPEQNTLLNFSLYLKGEQYLQYENELLNYIEQFAEHTESNGTLTILTYTELEKTFRITYFKQLNFIRLTINQLSKHN